MIKTKEITDKKVYMRIPLLYLDILPPGTYLAGGSCIKFFDSNHVFTDYDIFTTNANDTNEVKARLLKHGFTCIRISSYSVTFRNYDVGNVIVQIIESKTAKTIAEIFNKFDIEACKVATDGKTIFYTDEAKESILCKVIDKLGHISNSYIMFKRLTKYAERGYNVKGAFIALTEYIRKTKPEDDLFDPDMEYEFESQPEIPF